MDPVDLARALIRCPSVTPKDEGALAVLEKALTPLGFICHRLHFEHDGTAPIDNLYARIGTAGPNFCFAGHTDVVPPGDAKLWKYDPFGAVIENGTLYGRGAVDMKTAVACFASAASRFIGAGKPYGSISLLITGDEDRPPVRVAIPQAFLHAGAEAAARARDHVPRQLRLGGRRLPDGSRPAAR